MWCRLSSEKTTDSGPIRTVFGPDRIIAIVAEALFPACWMGTRALLLREQKKRFGVGQEMARRLFRRAFQSKVGTSFSISSCVRCHTGTARARSLRPFSVRMRTRLRRSDGSDSTVTRPRRSRGFNAAVRVVRSMASREATGPIGGGSGLFSDMSSENCPLVSSKGRSASSKRRASARAARCTWRHRQRSRTNRVVSYGSVFALDTEP